MAKRYKEVPRYEEMHDYLDQAISPQWKTIAKALYYTGARIGELVQIEARHVWEEPNFIKIKLLTEKNQQDTERIIPISKKVESEGANIYLSLKEGLDKNALLFPKPPGVQLESYLRVMRRDFNEEYSNKAPHYFRHCRATHMVTRFGYDAFQLTKYMGWSDERPAKHYVKLRTEDLEAKMV